MESVMNGVDQGSYIEEMIGHQNLKHARECTEMTRTEHVV